MKAGIVGVAVVMGTIGVGLPVAAQRPQRSQQEQQQAQAGDSVPKAYRPPPGMCRIWLDKVPPRQQPAPTDCPTAVKNKSANGRVIFGDDFKEKGKDDKKELPFLKKFGADRTNP